MPAPSDSLPQDLAVAHAMILAQRAMLAEARSEAKVRALAIGRGNWTFCGSDAGGHRAAAVYTLVETCKLNDVDPQAWLAYVLAKLPDHPAKRIDELLPWNWKASQQAIAEAA
jgi:transposase